jgi:hypothetical protein
LSEFAPKAATGSNYVTDTALKSLISSTGANSVIIPATGGMLANLPAYGSWKTYEGNLISGYTSEKTILWRNNIDTTNNTPSSRGINYNSTNGSFKFDRPGLYQIAFVLSITPKAPEAANINYTTTAGIYNNNGMMMSIPIDIVSTQQNNPTTTVSTFYSLTSIIRITDINTDNISIKVNNISKLSGGSLNITWLSLN